MAHQESLSQWIETVSTHLKDLSPHHATIMAVWSFGMVIAQSCGITSVAVVMARLLQQKENTVRQRLRESTYDSADQRGKNRTSLDVTTCFAPLLQWILAWWDSHEQRLALAMDATTLGQRFTVLTISVVYRGCAIPVAWTVLSACQKGAWKPHWIAMLETLAPAVPPTWTVIVLADRGLYARWLFRHICKHGWHPFLRINKQGNVRPDGMAKFRPLSSLVPTVGSVWSGSVTCFSTPDAQLRCTLLARWDEGYTDPWIIVTDVAPDVAEVAWYGVRTWIEGGFKDTKRGGWHWEQTKMTDPARATRLWLAIALATMWVVSVGGEVDATLPASTLDELPDTHMTRRRPTKRSRPRLVSCFRRGVLVLLTSLIAGDPLPFGRFLPEPWPQETPMARIIPLGSRKTKEAA